MTNDEQGAWDAVRRYLECYERGDVDGCVAMLAASGPLLLFGTNDNEIFQSVAQARAAFTQDFASMSGVRWGAARHLLVAAGSELASVVVELPVGYASADGAVQTTFRLALTLVRENGAWKIRAGLISVPHSSGTYTFAG
jgi:ketosteroid isomerase-like protein